MNNSFPKLELRSAHGLAQERRLAQEIAALPRNAGTAQRTLDTMPAMTDDADQQADRVPDAEDHPAAATPGVDALLGVILTTISASTTWRPHAVLVVQGAILSGELVSKKEFLESFGAAGELTGIAGFLETEPVEHYAYLRPAELGAVRFLGGNVTRIRADRIDAWVLGDPEAKGQPDSAGSLDGYR